MSQRIPITVANGDGIGPEIMAATLRILEASEAPLEIETIDIGEKVYLAGNSSGIEPSSWESLRRTKVFLKAPITTPQGGGYKSLNVTVRKVLGIVDIGAAKLADTPEAFDVIVMPNLYGDVLSDVAAQIAGSVGLAGSANIGEHVSMFEAIHGSAPRRAGQNLANPSGLLLGAVMMLVHIGQHDMAEKVHNGWLKTIEDGVHTYDIFKDGTSKKKVGTKEFAKAVIERLGEKPSLLKAVTYKKTEKQKEHIHNGTARTEKILKGVDIFLDSNTSNAKEIADVINNLPSNELRLSVISNRGVELWPNSLPETFCTD